MRLPSVACVLPLLLVACGEPLNPSGPVSGTWATATSLGPGGSFSALTLTQRGATVTGTAFDCLALWCGVSYGVEGRMTGTTVDLVFQTGVSGDGFHGTLAHDSLSGVLQGSSSETRIYVRDP